MSVTVNDRLSPLAWLLGDWQGEAHGEPGTGRQRRRYEPVLRGEFIKGTNRTVWVPKPGASEPEVHEDLSLISYDRSADGFVMHVFYVERFVARYVCAPPTDAGDWVFTAEQVQNGPPGMRARETLSRRGDGLAARFELAMADDTDFAQYTEEMLTRDT